VQITEGLITVDSVNHIEALDPDISNGRRADSITSTTLQGQIASKEPGLANIKEVHFRAVRTLSSFPNTAIFCQWVQSTSALSASREAFMTTVLAIFANKATLDSVSVSHSGSTQSRTTGVLGEALANLRFRIGTLTSAMLTVLFEVVGLVP